MATVAKRVSRAKRTAPTTAFTSETARRAQRRSAESKRRNHFTKLIADQTDFFAAVFHDVTIRAELLTAVTLAAREGNPAPLLSFFRDAADRVQGKAPQTINIVRSSAPARPVYEIEVDLRGMLERTQQLAAGREHPALTPGTRVIDVHEVNDVRDVMAVEPAPQPALADHA